MRPGSTISRAVLTIALVAPVMVACGSGETSQAPRATGEPPTERVPVIIDTDLDVSDVAALAILLRDPRLDVRAVTVAPTGTGVTTCASGRRLIRHILEEVGVAAIPGACGRENAGPDARPFPPEWRAAADTGWGMTMPPPPGTGTPETAVELLGRAVDASPSAPTIVALGPWTNLEDAVRADPTFADRIAGLHAMAGAIDVQGNVIVDDVTAADGLEWNMAADPSAAVALFETTTPISIVPLDATNDVPVDQDLLTQLEADHAAAGADLVYETLIRVPERITGDGQQLWDELAALTLADPDLVTWEEADILADASGRLARDPAGRSIRFAVAADRDAIETAMLEALRRGPARATPFELSGELTVTWDGTTCATGPFEAIAPGVVRIAFENLSGKPAGVIIIGARAPHTWPEVVSLVTGLDLETQPPPDWIIEGAIVSDEAGTGVPAAGTMIALRATYGPICVNDSGPDPIITPGDSFEVTASP
ncbi:MAG: nucleoside hydrolase [Candidatus Limnocylindrales bacterium]